MKCMIFASLNHHGSPASILVPLFQPQATPLGMDPFTFILYIASRRIPVVSGVYCRRTDAQIISKQGSAIGMKGKIGKCHRKPSTKKP